MQDARVETIFLNREANIVLQEGEGKIISGLYRRVFAGASFLFQWLAVFWQPAIQ